MKRSPLKRKPRKKQPGDDPAYLRWIRALPCLICAKLDGLPGDVPLLMFLIVGQSYRQKSHTEAAHVGSRAYGRKCPDRQTLPLCIEHHREGPDSHHKLGKKFWERHAIDRDAMIAALNTAYERYNQCLKPSNSPA